MPHRHYIARKSPPSLDDQILAHPYVLVFSIMSLSLGLWIIGGAVFGYTVSNTLERGEPLIRALAASPAVIGGVITLLGLSRGRRADRLVPMAIECTGVLVMAAAWTCYGILLAEHAAGLDRIPPWGIISFFLALAHTMHGIGLVLSIRRIRSVSREIEQERAEQGG